MREASFYWWRRELARRDAATPMPAFMPVMMPDGAAVVEGDRKIIIELRGGRVLQLWKRLGRRRWVYLPPYSPDLNP